MTDQVNLRGVPVDVYGEKIVFRPIEIGGEHGWKKTEAWDAYVEKEEEAKERGDTFASKEQRMAFAEFARTLLVQNYGEEKAKELAESLPISVMPNIFSLAWTGKEDLNFIEDGGLKLGSPGEKSSSSNPHIIESDV